MTKQERLIISVYTGVLMCGFSGFWIYVEQFLQRPIFTCELTVADVWQEIKKKSRPALLALCRDGQEVYTGEYIMSCGKDKIHRCTDDCFLRVTEGSRLKDLKYNNIACFCSGSSIYDDGKEVSCGFIREVLRSVAHLVDREVESYDTFFDMFVIRPKKK